MAKCVLLDIEGTVCPISFVKETLFPYAIKALPSVLATKWSDPDFIPYRDAFPEEHRKSPGTLQAHVEDLTRQDVKIAYLKNLQGYLWETGYKTGAYSTDLFPDVVPQLRKWKADEYILAIYSSGSVFAQKLLFGHVRVTADQQVLETHETTASSARTGEKRDRPADDHAEDQAGAVAAGAAAPPSKKLAAAGGGDSEQDVPPLLPSNSKTGVVAQTAAATSDSADDTTEASTSADAQNGHGKTQPTGTEDLTALFDGWFDTTNAGLKTEASSYTKIAEALKLKPEEIHFLSDNVKEVDAAIAAGMQSTLVDRPGNAVLPDADRERLEVVEALHDVNMIGPSACST